MSVFKQIIESLDVPPTYYEKAVERYKDISEWLTRTESTCRKFSPHIFPQGSMRLGTSVKPIAKEDEFDLDLSNVFKSGLSKNTHSQGKVVEILRYELELYRQARGIDKKIEKKHRCLRLEYKDGMSFHIDIVPGIPEETGGIEKLEKSMITHGELMVESAKSLAQSTIAITDDQDMHYNSISLDWNISNPEGFAKWVESQYTQRIDESLRKSFQIDDIPFYKRKTILQQTIQLLKRHRDVMYINRNKDCKPISIIITTLAARAYNGEATIENAVLNILDKMPSLIKSSTPKISNPVNPQEDFADKWDKQGNAHLQLERNFRAWIAQANTDIRNILRHEKSGSEELNELCKSAFESKVNSQVAPSLAGNISPVIIPPTAPKPWSK